MIVSASRSIAISLIVRECLSFEVSVAWYNRGNETKLGRSESNSEVEGRKRKDAIEGFERWIHLDSSQKIIPFALALGPPQELWLDQRTFRQAASQAGERASKQTDRRTDAQTNSGLFGPKGQMKGRMDHVRWPFSGASSILLEAREAHKYEPSTTTSNALASKQTADSPNES